MVWFKMMRIFQLSLLSLTIVYVKCDDLDYCYAEDKTPYELFSTWTPGSKAWVYTETKAYGCKPIYVWALLKHGIKSFTDEQIKRSQSLWNVRMDIEQNQKENRSTLCWDDYNNLYSKSVSIELDKKQNEVLAKEALSAHKLFATHLRQVMESSPSFIFSQSNIEIQTSEAKEAKESAITFAKSFLMKSSLDKDVIIENKELLKTKNTCGNWKTNHQEADDFIKSPIVESIRLEVSYRLGFTFGLPMETIMAMYESCVFWNILTNLNKPPFCAAFTPSHLKIMEYWQDLEHYYEYGYGNKLSEKMGCPLVNDMIEKISTAASGKWEEQQGSNKVSSWIGKRLNIYFADEENLMSMITKMGLYRDEVTPNHNNYYLQKYYRNWTSSSLSPYDASVHAILYNCENNEKMVEFYHNHNIVKFRACRRYQDGKCPLNIFLAQAKKNLTEVKCDKDYCGSFPQKSSGNRGNIISYSLSFILVILIGCFFFNRLHMF